jgi:predicted transcriptional regulator
MVKSYRSSELYITHRLNASLNEASSDRPIPAAFRYKRNATNVTETVMIEALPRREREVFELLCGQPGVTAAVVRAALADPLSDSAVRTLLRRLEDRGLVARQAGPDGFVYRPVPQASTLAAGALRRMVDTFFAGSAASAATALLGMSGPLKPDEVEALERLIDAAREPEA